MQNALIFEFKDMKIVLIKPPRLFTRLSKTQPSQLPLGLAYIAGTLRNCGHSISIIDATAPRDNQVFPFDGEIYVSGMSNENIINAIPEDAEIIGLSCLFSMDWPHTRLLIKEMRLARPKAVIVLGGEHATAASYSIMNSHAEVDYVVHGEGEQTIVSLIAALSGDGAIENIPALIYRDKDGHVCKNQGKPRIKELDKIAPPAWDLFPLDLYFNAKSSYGVTKYRSIPILATRGCPYACTFCSNPNMYGHLYYKRDPKAVVDEMQDLNRKYGVRNFDFYDLTTILNRDWIISFTDELLSRNLQVSYQFPSGTRSEVIDEEVAQKLVQSGCEHITFAPESGSPRLLKDIKKRVVVNEMLKRIRICNQQGMVIKLNIILGFPHERHEDIWRTLLFLLRASWAGAYDAVAQPFNAFPGTKIYDELVEEGIIGTSEMSYYYDLIHVDHFSKTRFLNRHMHQYTLRFYYAACYLLFYFSNWAFYPSRLISLLRCCFGWQPNSRGEKALVDLVKRYFSISTSKRTGA